MHPPPSPCLFGLYGTHPVKQVGHTPSPVNLRVDVDYSTETTAEMSSKSKTTGGYDMESRSSFAVSFGYQVLRRSKRHGVPPSWADVLVVCSVEGAKAFSYPSTPKPKSNPT